MRHVSALITLGFASTVFAFDEAAAEGLEHHVTLEHDLMVGGYLPGAVVRPGSDIQVKDIPKATSRTSVDLRMSFGALRVGFEPFMLTVDGKNGPKVVGLHYDVLISPFECPAPKDGTWDVPWRKPCVLAGYAHRSEHNQDDGTYGWTYTNGLILKLRLRSSDAGRNGLWIWGQWVPSSGESPFGLTDKTDIAASRLENRLWLVGTSNRLRIGEGGLLITEAELRASSEGLASMADTTRFLQDLDISVGEGKGFKVQVGAEFGMVLNLRKADEIGRSSLNFALLLALPLGR